MRVDGSLGYRAAVAAVVTIPFLVHPGALIAGAVVPAEPVSAGSPHDVARFEGQVLGPDLEPVSGARVTMIATPDAGETKGSPLERLFASGGRGGKDAIASPALFESVSGKDGRFGVELPGEGPFNLRVDSAGLAPLVLESLTPSTASNPLYLQKGVTLSGSVFDLKTSKPVEAARVLARPDLDRGFSDPAKPEAFATISQTGTGGGFSLEHLAPGSYEIQVTAPGYARALLTKVSTEDDPGRQRLVWLEEGFDLSGKVMDGKGRGVAGATVSVSRSMPRRLDMASLASAGDIRTVTDASGAFTLEGIARTAKLTVRAETEGGASGRLTFSPTPGRVVIGGVELRVDRPATLAVKLQDAEGVAVGQATISISYDDEDLPGRPRGYRVRDEDIAPAEGGRLVAAGIPAGAGDLRIQSDGFKPLELEGIELRSGETTDLGSYTLDRGLSIGGTVVASDERSLKGVEVRASSFSSRRFVGSSGESDTGGRFLLSGLEDGRYTIIARLTGYGELTVEDVAAGTKDLELTLKRAGKITGRVVYGDPAAPVSSFSVRTHPKEESSGGGVFNFRAMLSGGSRSFNDPRGRFSLDGLTAGDYTIEINSPGFARTVREGVVVDEGGVADLGEVAMTAGAPITGRVTDPDGAPVAGAVVRVKPRGMFNFAGQQDEPATFSGLDGRFTLKGVSPGSQTIVAEREGHSKAEARVSAGGEAQAEETVLVMGRGGRISGVALSSDGTPRSGVAVMAMIPLDPMGGSPALTDDQGAFAFENLVPGAYTVLVVGGPGGGGRGAPGGMDSKQVTVREGETSSVVLGGGKSIRVHGAVSGPSGPVREARVLWFPSASSGRIPGSMRSATTDDIGRYEVQLPEPGAWMVRVVPKGERMDAGGGFEVEVPDTTDYSRDLVFSAGAINGVVMSLADNTPLDAVQVTAMRAATGDDAEAGGASSRSRWAGITARSDATGAYRIEGLEPGTYTVEAVKEGFAAESVPNVEVGGETQGSADFLLRAGRRIIVRVVDGSGQPQNSAMVGVLSDGEAPTGRTSIAGMTGVDGTASLGGLREGTHTLFAMTQDLAPSIVGGVEAPPDGDGAAEIRLTAGGSLEVRVVDADKQPIAGASVTLQDPGDNGMESLMPMIRRLSGVPDTTPGNGLIVFPRLSPGRYGVRAEIEGKEPQDASVDVREGAVASVTLRLE